MSQSNIIDIRKSSAPINKLNPDILYYIFTYVIYRAAKDRIIMKTAVYISHVCRYWRKSALGWPILWRFIDLNNSRKLIELFLSRSGDTPLELLYDETRNHSRHSTPGSKLEAYGGLILPRLCSLTLDRSLSQFLRVQNALHPLRLQPFRLRRLEIATYLHDRTPELLDMMPLEVSCLQSLILDGLNLPRLELPHNNVLTEFMFNPNNPPILSQLLTFLSSCPLLRRFKFKPFYGSALQIETPTSPLTINKLNLPKLENLDLYMNVMNSSRSPLDSTCFYYMRELSSRIGTMGLLSEFIFHYGDDSNSQWYNPSITLAPSNYFGLIPQETLRHFSTLPCLSINLDTKFSQHRSFDISAASKQSDLLGYPPLSLSGSGSPGPLCHRFLFEVIYAMPQITYLRLYQHALQNLISWDLDFLSTFPCLDTLELELRGPKYEDLKSLPMVFPKVRKLIVNANQGMTPKLLRTIAEIVVEVLELTKCSPSKHVQLEKVISTLRQRGVVVFDYPKEK